MLQRFKQHPRPSMLADIAKGAFQGDFATELGLPGAATQVVLSFIPVVGTLCALRDAAADKRRNDHPGMVLNLLSAVPVFGGAAKTAELLRHVRRLRRGYVITRRRMAAA